ncbi:MAG: topoisomerase DNA-binding C4 zinc finger domain-containing protein [Oscillospiraceae bacterium]|nr:topoisomerase DNA-binding C4 zinc finger domain-containing protein [Oscillospiraceae bacterium]
MPQPVPAPAALPVLEPAAEPAPASAAETAPDRKCPRCGAELVLRTAKKGNNAGKQFYGCSAFPKCRYTRNIPDN